MTDLKEPKNFWHAMIPAPADTHLIQRHPEAHDGVIRTPIIAFVPNASNAYSAPLVLTMSGVASMKNRAVEHFNGMVTDPSQTFAFGSVKEWLQVVGKTTNTDEEEPEEEAGLVGPEGDVEIEFTDKTYKQQSFFEYDDGTTSFLFTVPGGECYPKVDDNVSKIKRDEFQKAKKTMDLYELDQVHVMLEREAASEESDDDEDDGSDLI